LSILTSRCCSLPPLPLLLLASAAACSRTKTLPARPKSRSNQVCHRPPP
jgi:hypothetical protein